MISTLTQTHCLSMSQRIKLNSGYSIIILFVFSIVVFCIYITFSNVDVFSIKMNTSFSAIAKSNNITNLDNFSFNINIILPNNISLIKHKILEFLNLPFYLYIMNDLNASYPNKPWNALLNIPYLNKTINSNYTIKYCMMLGTGLGNILSNYWSARASVFLSNSSFEFFSNPNHNNECKLGRSNKFFLTQNASLYHNDLFTFYLPLNSSINMFNTYYNFTKYEYYILYKWNINTIYNFGGGYTYRTPLSLLFYNPLFIPIVRYETNFALNKYFENDDNNQQSNFIIDNNDNNIIIHFRCGDVIGIKNPDYGLLTLSFYKKAFKMLNASRDKSNVYFVTQLDKNSLRSWTTTSESKYKGKCNDLVMNYTKHIRSLYHFKNFKIIGNNDINYDFYNMVKVKNLIVSMSSFAQQAAICNYDGNILWPSYGPWRVLGRKLVSGAIWSPDKHFWINVDKPKKIYIVSTEYSGWTINSLLEFLITN